MSPQSILISGTPPGFLDTLQPQRYFTDRQGELDLLSSRVRAPLGTPLPVLVFYGIGGAGKTWLLLKMQSAIATPSGLPSAYIDLNRRGVLGSLAADPQAALFEIYRQLDTPCPRFLSAYALTRSQQRSHASGGAEHTALMPIGEAAAAEAINLALTGAASPGGAVIAAIKTALQAIQALVKPHAYQAWLKSDEGKRDVRELGRKTLTAISEELPKRLAADLRGSLSEHPGRGCRAVLFFDTVEHLRWGAPFGVAGYVQAERWLGDLLEALHPSEPEAAPFVQVVIATRDRLDWAQSDLRFRAEGKLEQRLIGGIPLGDAADFLERAGVPGAVLRQAIIEASSETGASPASCHPLSLGLAADAVRIEQGRGVIPDPATFRLPGAHLEQLVQRFRLSFGSEEYARRIDRLASTPRFDEAAARAVLSQGDDLAREAAWKQLMSFSFLQASSSPGWYLLHIRMREPLRTLQGADAAAADHAFWRSYWTNRSSTPTDEFSGLAWYHYYFEDQSRATWAWWELAESLIAESQMAEHAQVLSWWAPVAINDKEQLNEDDAEALYRLAVQLGKATVGDRTGYLREAIACCQAALTVYEREIHSDEWARVKNNLGNSWLGLTRGPRNLIAREAIQHYEDAQEVYSRERHPSEWATLEHNLGIAYHSLPSGDRAENVQRAIAHLQNALKVRTKRREPTDWANSHNALAAAYDDLPIGNRNTNGQLALKHYKSALTVFTRGKSPIQWARAKTNLAAALAELPSGEKAKNLREAKKHLRGASQALDRERFPDDWATIQMTLGNVYDQLAEYGETDALQKAVAHYERALQVYDRDKTPELWAKVQMNLGITNAKRPTGQQSDWQDAHDCLTAALQVFTAEAHPQEWAVIQYNFGSLCRHRPDGDLNENLRDAIGHYRVALDVYRPESHGFKRAVVHMNLGRAYQSLTDGDRAAHLAQAELFLSDALTAFDPQCAPYHQGITLIHLAAIDEERGDLKAAIGKTKSAIAAFEAAQDSHQVATSRKWLDLLEGEERARPQTNDQLFASLPDAIEAPPAS